MNEMALNEYQHKAVATSIYPGKGTFIGVVYTALKLNGEAGEVAEKVGKIIRDEGSILTDVRKAELKLELGDVLWYIANQASELGFSLEEIARANMDKLASRKARGTLSGSGDNR